MKTAAIVVTYNGMEWIERCLESLKNSKEAPLIIVIDNNSSDETASYVKSQYPDVHLIDHKRNHGFGKANNEGISIALKQQVDFFFLLNQDAWNQGDTISELVNQMIQNPDFGIISPVHLNGEGDLIDFGFYNCITNNSALLDERKMITDALKNQKRSLYQYKFINAAAWLISKRCIETVGGFDPLFYHYGEDNNYCQRANYHGFKVGLATNAFVCHDREQRMTKKNEISENRVELNMLKTISDINNTASFDYQFQAWRNRIRKNKISALLLGDVKEWEKQKKLYKTLLNSKATILKSIEINKKVGLNWLEDLNIECKKYQ